MSSESVPIKREWMRLKSEFKARLDEFRPGPDRDQFAAFHAKRRNFPRNIHKDWWKRLKRKDPVPRELAESFVEYFRELWGWGDLTLGASFEPASPDFNLGAWSGMDTVLGSTGDFFESRDEMYCRNRADTVLAAQTIVMGIGEKIAQPGEPVDDESCLRRGEKTMQRSWEDYRDWLNSMRTREPRSVMFSILRRESKRAGTKQQRASISVILPLTENAYHRLLKGEAFDHELTPDDLQTPSKHVFVNSLHPLQHARVTIEEQTAAEVHCVGYQLAYLTRGLRPFRPVVITFISNPESRERLCALGYQPTGTSMRETDKPIFQLAHPKEFGKRSNWYKMNYFKFQCSLKLYQMANRWRDNEL